MSIWNAKATFAHIFCFTMINNRNKDAFVTYPFVTFQVVHVFYTLEYGPAHTLYLSPDGFFKKQELPAKRVSDTEELLKDTKTNFLCHLINVVLNSDLFSIAINFSSCQHLNLPPVASIIKKKVLRSPMPWALFF